MEEVDELREFGTNNVNGIMQVLASVPQQMLLLFKCKYVAVIFFDWITSLLYFPGSPVWIWLFFGWRCFFSVFINIYIYSWIFAVFFQWLTSECPIWPPNTYQLFYGDGKMCSSGYCFSLCERTSHSVVENMGMVFESLVIVQAVDLCLISLDFALVEKKTSSFDSICGSLR